MYFSMLNLICFVCFTTIFIKYGSITDIKSLIVLSVSGLIFISVFVRFYFNPHPCGYFRYSFRKTSLAFSHYYIMIVFLIGATIMVSPILEISFASIIPCMLMFFYTLLYRPYIDFFQNLRSAFNLLVMSVFCGIFILTQYISPDNYNTMPTYIFLLVGLLVLIVVLVISFLSSSYYFYYYKYKVPKERKMLKENDEIVLRKQLLK